jgi:uncharacterized protein YjbI with pentapeptide repeats
MECFMISVVRKVEFAGTICRVLTALSCFSWGASGKALAADPTPRETLIAGKALHFRKDQPDQDRTIKAAWLEEAARTGRRIDVCHAIIVDRLDLKYSTFAEEVALIQCSFEGDVDFSCSTFKRNAIFSGSSFRRKASFSNVTADFELNLIKATFWSNEAEFRDLRVRGLMFAEQLKFDAGVQADFERAHFEKDVVFWGADFGGTAIFRQVHIGGHAEFPGAQFKQDANFNAAVIAGAAFFRAGNDYAPRNPPSVELTCRPAVLSAPGGEPNYPPAAFAGGADFVAARIGLAVDFQHVHFRSPDAIAAFDMARIGSIARFEGAVFAGPASFNSFSTGGDALFGRAKFTHVHLAGKDLPPDVNFALAKIGGRASFPGARFDGAASFSGISVGGHADYGDAFFKNTVDFGRAAFRVVAFPQSEEQYSGGVDLRGSLYERLDGDWRPVFSGLAKLVGDHKAPYDRQPYTQLEKTLRATGDDDEADKVYLERRRVENQRMPVGTRLLDSLYGLLTNYGVSPYGLIPILTGVALILGVLVFARPGAMKKTEAAQLPEQVSPVRAGYWDSLRLTTRLFLPVEVPLLREWQPSEEVCFRGLRFADVATFLKIAGWILVPLGVAGLAGLLKHAAGP